MKCWGCDSEAVRTYTICVDGKALRVAPELCGDHGDALLLRVGRVIGELLMTPIVELLGGPSTQLGRSSSAQGAPAAQETAAIGTPETDKGPLPNRSGRLWAPEEVRPLTGVRDPLAEELGGAFGDLLCPRCGSVPCNCR